MQANGQKEHSGQKKVFFVPKKVSSLSHKITAKDVLVSIDQEKMVIMKIWPGLRNLHEL